MEKFLRLRSLLLIGVASLLSTAAFGQASPEDITNGTVAGSIIKITYHSPSVKGRKIWGDLVPYNEVWRTGANEATIFETSKDIKIGGKTLKAGKYSLYTKPTEKEWQVIFNSETGQWGINNDGSTTDDSSKDVLVTSVKPVKSEAMNERFKISINDKGFILLWENLAVPVAIE